MHSSIVSHEHRIDILFQKAAAITDPADQAHWAKYLCVLVSGYIEESLRTLLEQYALTRAAPVIQNYVSRSIGDITNCSINKMRSILARFSHEWEVDFQVRLETHRNADQLKNAVDSVVANRHEIVHGRQVGLRYASIVKFWGNVKVVIGMLDSVIK